jgi:hypothetical protein
MAPSLRRKSAAGGTTVPGKPVEKMRPITFLDVSAEDKWNTEPDAPPKILPSIYIATGVVVSSGMTETDESTLDTSPEPNTKSHHNRDGLLPTRPKAGNLENPTHLRMMSLTLSLHLPLSSPLRTLLLGARPNPTLTAYTQYPTKKFTYRILRPVPDLKRLLPKPATRRIHLLSGTLMCK